MVLKVYYSEDFIYLYRMRMTGCGSAWLERLVWDQEVAGSNPVTPIDRKQLNESELNVKDEFSARSFTNLNERSEFS